MLDLNVTRQLQGACHHVAHHNVARNHEGHPLRSRQVPSYLVSHLPDEKADVGETRGGGKGELDHHVAGAAGGGVGEDEVGGGGDEDAQDEEERPGDHCMPSVGLVNTHQPKVGSEVPELNVNAGEATCVQHPAKQQWLSAATGGYFHDDASSRHRQWDDLTKGFNLDVKGRLKKRLGSNVPREAISQEAPNKPYGASPPTLEAK
ncbi:hypothetical protein B296_00010167 [Ensete ventricosum]|uniref:Uncharacterized protein n=1 Tax=Ensete ventricosum TaxID=4639 RepID=A0A427BAA5_ENSVE|nr:hypothetical protein B296_00010167 [Ensete ventricosum]